MPRIPEPQISFADAEMKAQRVGLDKTLPRISEFLDGQEELLEEVHKDLVRGLKKPHTGRDGMTAAQVLRCFVLWRFKNWDLRELRERIADGYTTREFTRFYSRKVPSHQTLNSNFNRLTADTLRRLNTAVVEAAVGLGLEDSRKLRVDTTVVETNIHFPTDSGLLWDAVRVLTRLARSLREQLPQIQAALPDRTRRAKRRAQEISRMSGRQRSRPTVRKYRDLLKVTEEVITKAAALATEAGSIEVLDPLQHAIKQELASQIEHFCGLGERVVAQTRRRVIQGEQVPVEDKIFSIFEPHTDIVIRGKARTPVEFGHKVLLVESGQGLITDYQVLRGNPSDQDHVKPVLDQHQQTFGGSPALFAADRGFHSEDNLEACKQAGVKLECIPQRGGQKTPEREAYEKSRAFKQGQRFRAGIEGRISVLLRGRGLKRCNRHGLERFETFVGAAVLANNLLVLSTLIQKKRALKRPLRPPRVA